jgi:hypothetical protein
MTQSIGSVQSGIFCNDNPCNEDISQFCREYVVPYPYHMCAPRMGPDVGGLLYTVVQRYVCIPSHIVPNITAFHDQACGRSS